MIPKLIEINNFVKPRSRTKPIKNVLIGKLKRIGLLVLTKKIKRKPL
jgi:hypothetical protein